MSQSGKMVAHSKGPLQYLAVWYGPACRQGRLACFCRRRTGSPAADLSSNRRSLTRFFATKRYVDP